MNSQFKILFNLPLLLVRHRGFIKKFGFKAFRNSLRLNFRSFEFRQAAKFPIYVAGNYHLKSLEGRIVINVPAPSGLIQFGTYEIGTYHGNSDIGIIDLKKGGELIFHGKALFGVGCRLSINEKGKLSFGKDFTVTAASTFICSNKIQFGSNCLLSWENLFMDTDLHTILPVSDKKEEIRIGDRNWFGCRCTVLKSTITPNNCVIGANSLINSAFSEENTLISGNPAKILKSNVNWK